MQVTLGNNRVWCTPIHSYLNDLWPGVDKPKPCHVALRICDSHPYGQFNLGMVSNPCMAVANAMWVERYRPQKLADIVNQRPIISSITALLKKESEMPHMLFAGSAGIGKTTTALCIARQVLGSEWRTYTLELNASDERGINMVREKVKKFSRWASFGQVPFKIIILDEADEMTSDAQTALRRIIEDTSQHCRFLITANNISRIIEPIQSRCAVFRFTAVMREDVIARLADIAKSESVEYDDDGIQTVYEYTRGDLRHAINLLQTVASSGKITHDRVKESAGLAKAAEVEKILKLALDGNFQKAREDMIDLLKVFGMSGSDFLRYLAGATIGKKPATADVMKTIAEYDYRILVGSNPEIQLSALLADLGRFKNSAL